MKKLLFATAALIALTGAARADIVLDNKLNGTGDNVNLQSVTAGSLVVGTFNGKNQGLVDFSCLGGCGGFTGVQNGQDMKINNFNDLKIQVFGTGGGALATATDVFSITGTGDVTIFATANEADGTTKLFTFDTLALFGPLGPGQNGFTLTAINNESIASFRVVDQGGVITDFEHYRIDIAGPLAPAVPEASTWMMLLLGFAGVGLAGMRKARSNFRLA